MKKPKTSSQLFEIQLLRSFWLSYISGAVAIVLAYIFNFGASPVPIAILSFTLIVGVAILIASFVIPDKLKHLSKIVSCVNIFLVVVSFIYLLLRSSTPDTMKHHLQFSALILVTPLMLFHLFIAFKDQLALRINTVFYTIILSVGLLFLLGFGAYSRDYFVRASLINFLFVTTAYLFIFNASFRLMRKEHEAKTKALLGFTYRDSITKLANRTAYTKQLKKLPNLAEKTQGHIGLILIDIDGFKRINDNYGQPVGNRCLRLIAKRIKSVVPSSSFVARTDGDEFSLLVPLKNIRHLDKYCELLTDALAKTYDVAEYQLSLPVSMSACQYPKDGKETPVLLKKLDWAMNVAKTSKDDYTLYDSALGKRMYYKESIEDELALAIENKEFELHYQAIMNLKSGKVDGAEALLRWNNPNLGRVSPEDFIPVAETSGLILPIGSWVLEKACIQLREWLDAGFDISIAVNISMAQFKQENFIDDIRILLARYKLDPLRLELEVTESLAFDDTALHRLKQLQAIGCTVKLDDFGTGYSSLAILSSLPLNELKIDKSFVQELDNDYNSLAWTMIKTILNLAQSFKLEVVAEGVEKQLQLDYLQKLGCEFAQGYHISKPISGERFYQQFLYNAQGNNRPANTDYQTPNHQHNRN